MVMAPKIDTLQMPALWHRVSDRSAITLVPRRQGDAKGGPPNAADGHANVI
jgi:hypothetical protein